MLANLHAQQVTTSVAVEAPREGRPSARINWLLRQLAEAPAELRIEAAFAGTRETAALMLSEAREYPQRLLSSTDPKREPRAFTLALTRRMGLNRGKGQGSFVRETRRQVIDFYGEIVQGMKAWQARAPKLPETPAVVPEEPQHEPPPFVAVDKREPGGGTTPREDETGF